MLFAQVVDKTINVLLSHCPIAPYFSSFDQSNFSSVALLLPFPWPMSKSSCHRDVATKTGPRRRDGQKTAKREREKKKKGCAPCARAFFTFCTFRSRSCLIRDVK